MFADTYTQAIQYASYQGLEDVPCKEVVKDGLRNHRDRLGSPEDGCLGLQCSSEPSGHCGNERTIAEVAVQISTHFLRLM